MILFIYPYKNKFGPSVHANDFINFVKIKNPKDVVVASFEKQNNSDIVLQINNGFFTFIYSIFFLLPRQSAKYFNYSNIKKINKFIKKYNCKRVYFFGFSYTSFYSKFINHEFKILTSPDAQSLRYKKKFKSFKIKAIIQYFFYRFLELRTLKTFKFVHLVAKDDYNYLNLKNSIYLPFHLSVDSICSLEKEIGTILIISQIEFNKLKEYLNMLLYLEEIKEIVVLDYSNKLKNKIKFNKKVKFINWIDNYEIYTSQFHFLLTVDPLDSTGMSTRTTHNIYSGNIVLGNKIAFRNINDNNQFDEYIFQNLTELKIKIKNIINEKKIRPSNYQINTLNNLMNFKKVFSNQYKLLNL